MHDHMIAYFLFLSCLLFIWCSIRSERRRESQHLSARKTSLSETHNIFFALIAKDIKKFLYTANADIRSEISSPCDWAVSTLLSGTQQWFAVERGRKVENPANSNIITRPSDHNTDWRFSQNYTNIHLVAVWEIITYSA